MPASEFRDRVSSVFLGYRQTQYDQLDDTKDTDRIAISDANVKESYGSLDAKSPESITSHSSVGGSVEEQKLVNTTCVRKYYQVFVLF